MRRSRRRPSVEVLEGRQLLAVTLHEIAIPTRASTVVAGRDGDLWFALGFKQIGRMSASGTITEIDVGVDPGDGMAVTPDGNVWFTVRSNSPQIGRLTPQGEVTLFNTSSSASTPPARLAAGPDGNVWFTETIGNKIGRLTPDGQVTAFVLPAAAGPRGITAGPDGNLWFTELVGNKIGRITPGGQITEFAIPPRIPGVQEPQAAPAEITTGPDGNLWFTEGLGQGIGRITRDGQITRFRLPTGFPSPRGITAGPDGNIWFTEPEVNQIGRITPDGRITEFTVPSAASIPDMIVAGPDGNLWFNEISLPQLGRLDLAYTNLGVAIAAQPASATAGQDLTYTITITNSGPNEGTNVVVTNPTPGGMTYISASASQGTVRPLFNLPPGATIPNIFIARLGTMLPGASATVTIVVRPATAGTLTNSVSVQADESDTSPSNDSAVVTTTVAAAPPGGPANPPGGGGPIVPPPAPIFTGQQRLYTGKGKRRKLVGFQLHFSAPLDLATASLSAHYRLTQPGRTKRAAPKVIAVRAVQVGVDRRSVTLVAGKYNAKKPLQLTATGLLGAQGQPLAPVVTRL